MAYLPTPPSESNVPACEATVYVPTPLHPTAEAEASKRFKHVLRPGVDGLTEADCLARSDAILLRIGKAKKLQLDQAPKLRIISRSGVGCDDIDLDICRERGIRVTNCPGENAKVVAELALTLALAVVRRVKEMDARIRSGEIVPSIYALSGSLFGATVGLIGMGDIAYSLAQLLKPFDCKILVFSPTSDSKRWTSEDDRYTQAVPHTRVDSLEGLCREVDILSIHCPLKPSTRNLISATELSWMKPSAIIINTARGGIIDEPALATALKEGRLGGAGLDVFESEPAHGETLGDLGKLPNVICLPHLGGSTDAIALSSTMMAVDIASGYLDGKGIRNVVV